MPRRRRKRRTKGWERIELSALVSCWRQALRPRVVEVLEPRREGTDTACISDSTTLE